MGYLFLKRLIKLSLASLNSAFASIARMLTHTAVKTASSLKSIFTTPKRIPAFSLIELMISLIAISVIAASFAPVMSKKMKASSLGVGSSGGEFTAAHG